MHVKIRDYDDKDCECLAMLFYRIRKEEFVWDNPDELLIDDFKRFTSGERMLVAEVDGKLVGYISVWEPDKFIHHLFVSEEYRRLGIGQALIRAVLAEYGVPLTLKCVVKNRHAVDFYLSNGWIIEKEDLNDGEPYYLMKFTGMLEDNRRYFLC